MLNAEHENHRLSSLRMIRLGIEPSLQADYFRLFENEKTLVFDGIRTHATNNNKEIKIIHVSFNA